MLVAAGCRVDTKVEVKVNENGGGTVTAEVRLDEEAARAIDDLESGLSVDDLKSAGWKVDGPSKDGNTTVVKASHGFANPQEASALVRQLGGESGPFREFEIRQQRSLTSVEAGFVGTVDLSRGIESWADPYLKQQTDKGLGVDPAEIQRNLGVNLQEAVTVKVKVDLPGSQNEASPELTDGAWSIPYGSNTQLIKNSEGTNLRSIGLLVLAALLLIASVAVAVFWQTYKPRHKRPKEAANQLS